MAVINVSLVAVNQNDCPNHVTPLALPRDKLVKLDQMIFKKINQTKQRIMNFLAKILYKKDLAKTPKSGVAEPS